MTRCLACGGHFADSDETTHGYMLSSPGCWHAYGLLLAREYQDPTLFAAAHRLSVDAYALQHRGAPDDRRAAQSVWLHYCALLLVLDRGASFDAVPPVLRSLSRRAFEPLPPGPSGFAVTHADVTAENHVEQAREWARAAFDAWAELKPAAQRLLA